MQPKIKMTQRKLDTLEKQYFCQQSNKQTRLIRKEKNHGTPLSRALFFF
jgi:hypothetical protein